MQPLPSSLVAPMLWRGTAAEQPLRRDGRRRRLLVAELGAAQGVGARTGADRGLRTRREVGILPRGRGRGRISFSARAGGATGGSVRSVAGRKGACSCRSI